MSTSTGNVTPISDTRAVPRTIRASARAPASAHGVTYCGRQLSTAHRRVSQKRRASSPQHVARKSREHILRQVLGIRVAPGSEQQLRHGSRLRVYLLTRHCLVA
jgi:hypothetical protein